MCFHLYLQISSFSQCTHTWGIFMLPILGTHSSVGVSSLSNWEMGFPKQAKNEFMAENAATLLLSENQQWETAVGWRQSTKWFMTYSPFLNDFFPIRCALTHGSLTHEKSYLASKSRKKSPTDPLPQALTTLSWCYCLLKRLCYSLL